MPPTSPQADHTVDRPERGASTTLLDRRAIPITPLVPSERNGLPRGAGRVSSVVRAPSRANHAQDGLYRGKPGERGCTAGRYGWMR